MNQHLQAFLAMHSPAAILKENDHVYEIWEDGELTLTKCGSLYGQRGLHQIRPPFSAGNPNCTIDARLFPEECQSHSRSHARIAVNNEAEVKVARKLLWEAIKEINKLGDVPPPYGLD